MDDEQHRQNWEEKNREAAERLNRALDDIYPPIKPTPPYTPGDFQVD